MFYQRRASIEEDASIAIAFRKTDHLYLLFPCSEVLSLLQRASALRVLGGLHCRHLRERLATRKVFCAPEAESRQLSCAGGWVASIDLQRTNIFATKLNFVPAGRTAAGFCAQVLFRGPRRPHCPCTGSSASPNLRAQLFREPRGLAVLQNQLKGFRTRTNSSCSNRT